MVRVCLLLCCVLLMVSLAESRVLTVLGKRCTIGVEMMYFRPGEERPSSCPSFVDEDGECVFGDLIVRRRECYGFLEGGEAEYNALPRAVYIEE